MSKPLSQAEIKKIRQAAKKRKQGPLTIELITCGHVFKHIRSNILPEPGKVCKYNFDRVISVRITWDKA